MNVKIEGEPMVAQAVRPNPSFDAPAMRQKLSSDPTSRKPAHKSMSDKGTDRAPAVGERLEVGLHESANVETVQPISGLSVEHPELCQVLKSGERSVSFVGLKAGQTRVALFTTNTSGERKIEIRDVVVAGAESRQADMKSLATEIGRSVRSMYPKSRIEVIAEAEGLTVQGYAGSEEEARKIIGLVRRTSLQPVVDRLATYK
jgi:Flp pilus assembly secretin CpaC